VLRKGTLTRRGGLPTFKPTGLAPQKAVSGLTNNDPTRDTYQRKVFYDGTNFFVWFWAIATKQLKYTASADGITWTTPVAKFDFGVAPYYGGNIDCGYPNRGTKDLSGNAFDFAVHFTGSNGAYSAWYPCAISSQTITVRSGASLDANKAQGGTIVCNLNATNDYIIYHRNSVFNQVNLQRCPVANLDDSDTTISHGGTSTGGNQLLPYKTSSPYHMFALVKGGDNKLYYNIVNVNATTGIASFADSFTEIATLGTGFSDFCSCSEAQNVGDPERIHIVYVKSTGELCHRKFENDALGSETVLVSSGASYPVIACGDAGKLYVFYVKDAKIYVAHFKGGWQNPVELFTFEHAYDTPTYLSCSQNVQSGKICLVWCEAEDSTFAVWFCYLED